MQELVGKIVGHIKKYNILQSKKIIVYASFIIISFILMLFCTKSSPLFVFNDWFDANVYFTMGKGLGKGAYEWLCPLCGLN